MTEKHHPVTPPDELIDEWIDTDEGGLNVISRIVTRAAQWAADQELDACCEYLDQEGWSGESRQLRAARRPEPPISKEQALDYLVAAYEKGYLSTAHYKNIRRALEQLDD